MKTNVLAHQGHGINTIARELGLSRNTIRKYLRAERAFSRYIQRGPPTQDLPRLRAGPQRRHARFGYSVRYNRLCRLLLERTQAKADGSYHKLLKQLAKVRLLPLDDKRLEIGTGQIALLDVDQ